MASTVNTSTLNAKLDLKVNSQQKKRLELAEYYKKEKRVEISISPMYRPYFGNNMAVQINTSLVYVPVDGQQYKLPESFAAVVKERIGLVDEQIRIREGMSNMQSNIESYAGEKGLLTKA